LRYVMISDQRAQWQCRMVEQRLSCSKHNFLAVFRKTDKTRFYLT